MHEPRLPSTIFVTGTGTGVGKTLVCGMLALGLNAYYWKPIQSGLPADRQWLQECLDIAAEKLLPERYVLSRPLSPHEAASRDRVYIELNEFALPSIPEDASLVVEGAGGIMVPINDHHFIVDLIKHLDLPALLVARAELGTINHTLLTLEKLKQYGISVAGVIMNGERNPGNRKAIERYGAAEVIAEVPNLDQITSHSLKECYRQLFGRV